jgi:NAD+ synthase
MKILILSEEWIVFDANKVKNQIVAWIADYFQNNASPETKAVIGISGGKDSSVVAALCVEALGKNRVLGVLMPQGEQHDIDISLDLCKVLDIEYVEINIKEPVQALYDSVTAAGLPLNNVAAFNTPARIRMTTLYAVSGIIGGRVANTSNLSEDWVGYATKFGDAAGDFSPLSDLTVAEVKKIGHALGLAPGFIDKVPIDGLCGKTDEDNLGFTYAVLDQYIREGVCDDAAIQAKIDRLHEANLHKVTPVPAFRLPVSFEF